MNGSCGICNRDGDGFCGHTEADNDVFSALWEVTGASGESRKRLVSAIKWLIEEALDARERSV